MVGGPCRCGNRAFEPWEALPMRERPVVVFVDDSQWAAPELLDLLWGVVSAGEGPVLVLMAARPEFASDVADRIWSLRPRSDVLELGPLDDAAAARIAEYALGGPL